MTFLRASSTGMNVTSQTFEAAEFWISPEASTANSSRGTPSVLASAVLAGGRILERVEPGRRRPPGDGGAQLSGRRQFLFRGGVVSRSAARGEQGERAKQTEVAHRSLPGIAVTTGGWHSARAAGRLP